MGSMRQRRQNLSWNSVCVKCGVMSAEWRLDFSLWISFHGERTFLLTCTLYIYMYGKYCKYIYTKSYRCAIKSAVCSLQCNPTRVFGYSALHNTALFQSWYSQSEFINLVCCLLSVGCNVIRHGCLGIQHCTTLPSSRARMHSQNLFLQT